MNGLSFSEKDGILTARLCGEIDHHIAKEERGAIDSELFRKSPKVLVLDFSAVRFMDSSGIGLIIGRTQTAEEIGCRVKICGLSSSLSRLVKLSGIGKIKNIELC